MSEIDLKKFCENDQCRPYLNNPFSIGDFTYASDGRIAVRTPRLEGVGEVDGAPDTIIKVFTENLTAFDQAKPVPKPPQVANLPCKACRRTGKVTPCETCGGEGYQECDLGHDHDCEDCDGNGVIAVHPGDEKDGIECSECDGLGRFPDAPQGLRTGVIIDGKVIVGLGYLRKLADLPSVKWSIDHRTYPEAPIPFWFDGGEGVLMPMRFYPDSENYLRVDTEESDAVVVNVRGNDRDRGGDNAPADLDAVLKEPTNADR